MLRSLNVKHQLPCNRKYLLKLEFMNLEFQWQISAVVHVWISIMDKCSCNKVNPFVPNAPFLCPLEISENLTVFWCFQGVEKGCIGNKCVKVIYTVFFSELEKAKKEVWTVSPEQIILNTVEEDATSTKLLMINYSNVQLPFEFIWPAQTLIITPSKDVLPPTSQLVVRINAKPSFLSRKGEIPWKGCLYIQCNGEQKVMNLTSLFSVWELGNFFRPSPFRVNNLVQKLVQVNEKDTSTTSFDVLASL